MARLVRERCDELVAIPMHGRLGSLNVSAAAAPRASRSPAALTHGRSSEPEAGIEPAA